jgi:glycosyltransferase involved in cell wall biosynthesis
MKINFIVPEIVRSGGMRVIFEYANRLTERSHDVTLFTPAIPFYIHRGKINVSYIKYQVKYASKYLLGRNPLPSNIFEHRFLIRFVPFVNNLFMPDSDAVIATAWQTADSVLRLNKSKGKKFYLIQDYEIWYGNPEKINESYTLPLKRITVSAYLQNLLKQKFGADSHKILNGVNTVKYRNDNKIYRSPKTLLFMDHALENKNTRGAIAAADRLKKKYPDLKVVCFGLGKFHELPEYVQFYLNPDEDTIVKLYCDADIFLFTSNYEGFGYPPAEAMACKCAVVGNSAGALPEYAVNNETAILTDPEMPEQLYEGVCRLLDDQTELKRISEAGYNFVLKKLNWDTAVDKLEELLQNRAG